MRLRPTRDEDLNGRFPPVEAPCPIAGLTTAFVLHPGGSGDATADRSVVGAYAVVATAP